MLLRSLGQSPPILQARCHRALASLEGLTANEQPEVACQRVVGILKACRPRFGEAQGGRAAYDTLCGALEEWLRAEIAPLRLPRSS